MASHYHHAAVPQEILDDAGNTGQEIQHRSCDERTPVESMLVTSVGDVLQPQARPGTCSAQEVQALDVPSTQLRFITTTNPKQDRDPTRRKLVRSHAAKRHHVVRQQAWKGDDEAEESRQESTNSQAKRKSRSIQRPLEVVRRSRRSLITPLGPGGTDPFASGSLPPNPRMNILIDHFITTVGPGMNAFITHSNTVDPIKTIYIPFSMADSCVFHGLLLLSARSYASASGDLSYNLTALSHKAQCIRLVNEALSISEKATSDAIVAAVLMLAVEELVLGNLDVFRTHLAGLQKIVSIRGGIHTLGLSGILLHLALNCDRASQLFTGSDPLFFLPQTLLEPPVIDSLPSGFQNFLRTPGVNLEVADFVAEAESRSLIKSFSRYEGTTKAEIRYSDSHCAQVFSHIYKILSSGSVTGDMGETESVEVIEACLCYSVCAYGGMMLRSIPPDIDLRLRFGGELKTALMRTDVLIHWRGRLELLLWIAFMGAQVDTTHGPLRDWFIYLLNGINDHLGTKPWEQIKSILQSFLWNNRCELLGRALWTEVEGVADQERVTYPVRLASTFHT